MQTVPIDYLTECPGRIPLMMSPNGDSHGRQAEQATSTKKGKIVNKDYPCQRKIQSN